VVLLLLLLLLVVMVRPVTTLILLKARAPLPALPHHLIVARVGVVVIWPVGVVPAAPTTSHLGSSSPASAASDAPAVAPASTLSAPITGEGQEERGGGGGVSNEGKYIHRIK